MSIQKLFGYNHCYQQQQNLVKHPDPAQQDTLVYADIGPSSLKKKSKHAVTLKPDDVDDRVEYALLNHRLQKPAITTYQDSVAGKIFLYIQLIMFQK
jgi:hypothetical protein